MTKSVKKRSMVIQKMISSLRNTRKEEDRKVEKSQGIKEKMEKFRK